MHYYKFTLSIIDTRIKQKYLLRSRKMRRGSGENIRKPVSRHTKKDDKHIQAGTEESLPAKDT